MKLLDSRLCIGWDSYNWGRALFFWLKYVGLKNKKLLELGCGCDNGGLSLWASIMGASEVVCSDYNFPRIITRDIHKQLGVGLKIEYKAIDATDIPNVEAFDIVCFKSMLGGIIREKDLEVGKEVLRRVALALKPNGWLLCAENLVGTMVHQSLRTRFGAGKNKWRYFHSYELEQMISEVSGLELIAKKNVGVLGCFGRSEAQRRLLGRIDKVFVERFVPEEYRYIQFIVARKL